MLHLEFIENKENKEQQMREYNLFSKRLEIWQHYEFLKINIQFRQGIVKERCIWQQKVKVLNALLTVINEQFSEQSMIVYGNVASDNQFAGEGLFSKTRAFYFDVVKLQKEISGVDSLRKKYTDGYFQDIQERLSEKNNFSCNHQDASEHKEIKYLLAQKKVEILYHLGNLQLNEMYKGNLDEKRVWREKIAVLSALIKYMNNGDIDSLNSAIELNSLYSKGWFSKTDVYVKEVKELMGRLPKPSVKIKLELPTVKIELPKVNINAVLDGIPFDPRSLIDTQKQDLQRLERANQKYRNEFVFQEQQKEMNEMLVNAKQLKEKVSKFRV